MTTEIIYPTKENLLKTADLLRNGGIVGLPTETVYGLAANAFDENAIKNVYSVKGRPSDNPLIIHCDSVEMIGEIAEISDIARVLFDNFSPGPFTLVLPKKKNIMSALNSGLDTVAVRIPKNDVFRKVISLCRFPIAAPSANLSGKPSPICAAHVFDDLNGKIPLIIDGGTCETGLESTVALIQPEKITILRQGAITKDAVEMALTKSGFDIFVGLNKLTAEKLLSPGLKYRHYSPSARVEEVFFYTDSEFNAHISTRSKSEKVKILDFVNNKNLRCEELFGYFRDADKERCTLVIVRLPKIKTGIWGAVADRVHRATGGNLHRKTKINPTIVGLTGNSGAGKSEISRILAQENDFFVVDCDKVARMIMRDNSGAVRQLKEYFPELSSSIDEKFNFNRKKCAELIFADERLKKRYEQFVFNFCYVEINKIISEKSEKYSFIVLDAPTLFEANIDKICDIIVAVVAPTNILIERIINRDKISESTALARINAQKSRQFFQKNSDFIIFNNGDFSSLEQSTRTLISNIRRKSEC